MWSSTSPIRLSMIIRCLIRCLAQRRDMDSINKNKWMIRAAAVIIFALGFLAGALSLNLYRMNRPNSQRGWMGHGRLQHIVDNLDLSEDQKTEVEKIFTDTRAQLSDIRKETQPRMNEVRSQIRTRMQAVLTPEQWQQFQQMMKAGREHRGREKANSE